MKKFTLFILLFLFLSNPIFAQKEGIKFTQQNWNQVIIQAAKEDKIIFIDAYTDWCQPCKKMDKQVFPQKLVGDFYNKNFVNVKLNMEKGIGEELKKKYDVFFFPTFLFLTADGTIVHRIAGYQSVPKLLELGKTAVDPSKRLSAFEERFEKGDRDPEFLIQYTNVRKAAMDGTHNAIAEEYLNTQKDWTTKENLKFIFKQVDDTDSKLFDYILENKAVFEKQFKASKVAGKIENLIYQKVYDDQGNASLDELDRLFNKVYESKVAEQASSRFKLNYYLEKKSSEKYAKEAVKYYKNFPPRDPSELSDVAYNFYDLDVSNKKLLKNAVKWTKNAVKSDPSLFNYEAMAAVYYKLGKKRKARKAANKAIDAAKKMKEDLSETQELLDKIKAM
ncbi:MAG: thioredoxin family protein [Saprospiraceae bacterium]